MTRDLKFLKELLDEKLISKEDFDKKKNEILAPQEYRFYFGWGLSFLKYFSWPLVALIAIVAFYDPIKTQLLQSQEVKIGSIYLKVNESARLKGQPDLTRNLAGLSPEAFKIFLQLASNNYTLNFISRSDDSFSYLTKKINIYKEFEERKLILVSEDLATFERFFLRLAPEESTVYLKPGEVPNSWTYEKTKDNIESSINLTLNKSSLKPEQIKRISEINLEVSEQGKLAFDLIFDAVTSEIRSSEKNSEAASKSLREIQ